MNYYSEWDPKIAEWLKNLISEKLIPNGHVDTRSITEVTPSDLQGFTQCHFFCGVSGWSLALQLAGWSPNRPVWTGSCPCQPYSNAGKGLGDADARNLWPVFFRLIQKCRPEHVFGEQIEAAIGKGWLDGISTDLEGEGYACGATVLGSHSVNSPTLRKRLYWVGRSNLSGLEGHRELGEQQDTEGWEGEDGYASEAGFWDDFQTVEYQPGNRRRIKCGIDLLVNGLSFKLADGRSRTDASRKTLLHGFGNAINPYVAAEFIKAYMEVEGIS